MKTNTIQITPEARQRLEAYYNEIVDRRKSGELADVSQYAARYCEQAARISVSLHAGLYRGRAHEHPLEVQTAENAVKLAKWFAAQQLALLAKGRRAAATKLEDEVLELVEKIGKQPGHGGVNARDVHRAKITDTPDAARVLLNRMESDGILVGEDVVPAHGGRTTRIFRRTINALPE